MDVPVERGARDPDGSGQLGHRGVGTRCEHVPDGIQDCGAGRRGFAQMTREAQAVIHVPDHTRAVRKQSRLTFAHVWQQYTVSQFDAPSPESGVLLVDDDSMVRGWVRLALEGTPFHVVGEASSREEAIELARRRGPDVLLIDYRLGDATGTELLRELRLAGIAAPAVLMTANSEEGFNESVRDAGGQGTVLKTGSVEELLAALRLVAGGAPSFDGRHPRRAPGRAALSPREREVLRLVAAGSTNREIAEALEISDETVKTLVARTFAKLGVRKRAEAVSEAHRLGLL
jgi:DNA-binding NarL/FixJ family response regulator